MTNKIADKKSGFASGTLSPVREQREAQIHTGTHRASSTKDFLQMASMAVPVLGAVGTLFVWGAANFYVGDVVVVCDQPSPDLSVNVYNAKGQATSFRVNRFQLMPGVYHVEVSTDGRNKYRADIDVQFHSVNRLVVSGRTQLGISRLAPNAVSSVLMRTPMPAEPEDGNARVTELTLEPSPAVDKARPSDQEVTAPSPIQPSQESGNSSMQPAAAAESKSKGEATGESSPAAVHGSATAGAQSQDEQAHRKWWRVFHKNDTHH